MLKKEDYDIKDYQIRTSIIQELYKIKNFSILDIEKVLNKYLHNKDILGYKIKRNKWINSYNLALLDICFLQNDDEYKKILSEMIWVDCFN